MDLEGSLHICGEPFIQNSLRDTMFLREREKRILIFYTEESRARNVHFEFLNPSRAATIDIKLISRYFDDQIAYCTLSSFKTE